MRWEFTPAEFLYCWEEIGWDRIPIPLAVYPDIDSEDDWQRLRGELRSRLPVTDDPDLLPVLRVAADPDISIAMLGTHRGTPLRVYGAVVTTVGVTMVQRATADPATGGNIIVQVGSAELIPKVCAAVSGETARGRRQPLVESVERLRDTSDDWMVRDEPSVADRIRDLLAAPRTSEGHIEVRADRHADRPWPPTYMSWFDVTDDGRYTYAHRHGDLQITPCTPDRFRHTITRLMNP
ncbi:MAG: ESX secretion-associated protein EspG [Nocardia sp.]|nr:ESX secretion-associated protein EspG [Nocardia sp.]